MTDPLTGRRLRPTPFVHYPKVPPQNRPPRDDNREQAAQPFKEHLYGPAHSVSSQPPDRALGTEPFPSTPPSVMELLAERHRAIYGPGGEVCTPQAPADRAVADSDEPLPSTLLNATDPLAERRRALYLELAQTSLDLAGIVDPTPVSDLTGAGLSALRGDGVGVLIAIAGIVPYVGDLAKLGKLPKLAQVIEESIALSKLDSAFGKSARPILQKLQTAMAGAAELGVLPTSAQRRLHELSQQLDAFLRQTPEQLAAGAKPNPNRPVQLTVKGLLEPDTLRITELGRIEQWEGVRNTFLKQWRAVDVSGFPPETQRLLQGKADKVIRKNMTPDDLAALMKENRGVAMNKPPGGHDNHKAKFKQAREAILNVIDGQQEGTQHTPGLKDRLQTLEQAGRTHTQEYRLLDERLRDLNRLLDAYETLQTITS